MRIHSQSMAAGVAIVAAMALFFAETTVPAVGIDESASAVRGTLSVSLEDLGLGSNLGHLSLFLNGGCALISGLFACFALAKRRRKPLSRHDRQNHRRRGDTVMNGAAGNAVKHI